MASPTLTVSMIGDPDREELTLSCMPSTVSDGTTSAGEFNQSLRTQTSVGVNKPLRPLAHGLPSGTGEMVTVFICDPLPLVLFRHVSDKPNCIGVVGV